MAGPGAGRLPGGDARPAGHRPLHPGVLAGGHDRRPRARRRDGSAGGTRRGVPGRLPHPPAGRRDRQRLRDGARGDRRAPVDGARPVVRRVHGPALPVDPPGIARRGADHRRADRRAAPDRRRVRGHVADHDRQVGDLLPPVPGRPRPDAPPRRAVRAGRDRPAQRRPRLTRAAAHDRTPPRHAGRHRAAALPARTRPHVVGVRPRPRGRAAVRRPQPDLLGAARVELRRRRRHPLVGGAHHARPGARRPHPARGRASAPRTVRRGRRTAPVRRGRGPARRARMEPAVRARPAGRGGGSRRGGGLPRRRLRATGVLARDGVADARLPYMGDQRVRAQRPADGSRGPRPPHRAAARDAAGCDRAVAAGGRVSPGRGSSAGSAGDAGGYR